MTRLHQFVTNHLAGARAAGLEVSNLWRQFEGGPQAFLEALYAVSPDALVALFRPFFKDGVLEALFAAGQNIETLNLGNLYAIGLENKSITEDLHREALGVEQQALLPWGANRRWLNAREWYLEPAARDRIAELVDMSIGYNDGLIGTLVTSLGVLEIVRAVPQDKIVSLLERIQRMGSQTPIEFAAHVIEAVPPIELATYMPPRLIWVFLAKVHDLIAEEGTLPAPHRATQPLAAARVDGGGGDGTEELDGGEIPLDADDADEGAPPAAEVGAPAARPARRGRGL